MAQTILLQQLSVKELEEILRIIIREEIDFNTNSKIQESDMLLTRSETCEFLKVDSSTLWHWTNKGKLKAYGIGHRRYYKKQEIIECLTLVKP